MPPRWQPSLEDSIDIAAYLLGADRSAIAALPRITLAESALHAPFASFAGTEAYPTLVEQAAVLLEHLAKNDPLPDANKRAAFLLTARPSTPTACGGDHRTCRPMPAWSNASPPARRRTTKSSHGSANAREIDPTDEKADESRRLP